MKKAKAIILTAIGLGLAIVVLPWAAVTTPLEEWWHFSLWIAAALGWVAIMLWAGSLWMDD